MKLLIKIIILKTLYTHKKSINPRDLPEVLKQKEWSEENNGNHELTVQDWGWNLLSF